MRRTVRHNIRVRTEQEGREPMSYGADGRAVWLFVDCAM